METIFFIIAGVIITISLILFIIDWNYTAKLNEYGKYELKVGYSVYFWVLLNGGMVVIMSLGTMDALSQKDNIAFITTTTAILFLVSMLYLIVEILNHRVLYNEREITKSNFLNYKSKIEFANLESIKYSMWGHGGNLIFKDNQGNRIKVRRHLIGFKSLVEFLIKLNLLEERKSWLQ